MNDTYLQEARALAVLNGDRPAVDLKLRSLADEVERLRDRVARGSELLGEVQRRWHECQADVERLRIVGESFGRVLTERREEFDSLSVKHEALLAAAKGHRCPKVGIVNAVPTCEICETIAACKEET